MCTHVIKRVTHEYHGCLLVAATNRLFNHFWIQSRDFDVSFSWLAKQVDYAYDLLVKSVYQLRGDVGEVWGKGFGSDNALSFVDAVLLKRQQRFAGPMPG